MERGQRWTNLPMSEPAKSKGKQSKGNKKGKRKEERKKKNGKRKRAPKGSLSLIYAHTRGH